MRSSNLKKIPKGRRSLPDALSDDGTNYDDSGVNVVVLRSEYEQAIYEFEKLEPAYREAKKRVGEARRRLNNIIEHSSSYKA